MALKFYTSVAKELKLKVRKFWGLIPTFGEVTGEKLVEGLFAPPRSFLILNRVKGLHTTTEATEARQRSVKTKININGAGKVKRVS